MKFFRFINNNDPMARLLQWMLWRFLTADLSQEEKEFVRDNITKHRKVLWLNLIGSTFVFGGLTSFKGDVINLITALLAPVMVMGGAWFAISFGAIPAKLIDCSMDITFWMFTSFSLSLTSMVIAVAYISPWPLWPLFVVIYVGAIVSCIMYDTSDGLKAGLDEAMYNHSRAALLYYKKEGISSSESDDDCDSPDE